MNFENNPCIRPPVKEESFNQLKVIDEKVNTLEKTVSDMADNIETKELNVTETAHIKNLEVENQSTTYESFSADTFTLNKINEETPILSTKVVGYDANGKLIPIEAQYEGFDLYDYIVDSQEKFNTLITLAKSAGGLTFKNVAIIGGYGDGTSGDYTYSPTATTNFNNANIVGYKSAKITVNVDDIATDDLVVFDNVGTFKNIDISAIGVVSTYDVVMFKNSTLNDLTINHTSYNPPYSIESCTLNNVVNKEYIKLKDCHLNNIETVQSEFEHCDSNHMYVKQNENENRKYKFTNCGLHLDTLEDDVTIDVAIVTESTLYCFDNQVNNKSFTLKIDDCDEESTVIGNKVAEELNSPNKTMISDAKKLGYVKYIYTYNSHLLSYELGYDILDSSRTLIKGRVEDSYYTTIDNKDISILSYTLTNTTGTFIGYGIITSQGGINTPKIARSIKDYIDGNYIDSTTIASFDFSTWHFVPITNMCDYYYKNADVYSCTDSDDTSHTVVYYVKNDILYRVYRTAECKPEDIIDKIQDINNNTIYYKCNNKVYTDLSLTTLASSTNYDCINWNITTIEKIKTIKALLQDDYCLNYFGINFVKSAKDFNPYDINGNLVTMYVENGRSYPEYALFSFDSENLYRVSQNKKVSLTSDYQTEKSYWETEETNADYEYIGYLYTPSLNYNVFVETPKNKYINTRGALYLKYVG